MADLVTLFSALSSLPGLQALFGGAITVACLWAFVSGKRNQPVPASPTLPVIGDPAIFVQGPQAMHECMRQSRDYLGSLYRESQEQTELLRSIRDRQVIDGEIERGRHRT